MNQQGSDGRWRQSFSKGGMRAPSLTTIHAMLLLVVWTRAADAQLTFLPAVDPSSLRAPAQAANESAIQVIDVTRLPRKPNSTREQQPSWETSSARQAAVTKVISRVDTAATTTATTYMDMSLWQYIVRRPVVKSKFTVWLYVQNLNGPAASPATGVLRVWAVAPPNAPACGNLPPGSTAVKIGSISAKDFRKVAVTIKAPPVAGDYTLTVFLDTCSKDPLYSAEGGYSYQAVSAPQPDLRARVEHMTTTNPAVGQEFKVLVNVTNTIGATGPNPKPFRIRLYSDTPEGFVPACSQADVPSIMSEPITKKIGVNKWITYTFTTVASYTVGESRLTVFLDSECELEEASRDDNVATSTYTVVPEPRLPDLVPALPTSCPQRLKQGNYLRSSSMFTTTAMQTPRQSSHGTGLIVGSMIGLVVPTMKVASSFSPARSHTTKRRTTLPPSP